MRWIRWPALLGLALVLQQADAIELALRDAMTGAPVMARLECEADTAIHSMPADGRFRSMAVAPSGCRARVRAIGYHDLDIMLDPGALPTTILLEPLTQPQAFARLASRIEGKPGERWIQGYLRRTQDGSAIAGAKLDFEGRSTQTDSNGYFELELAPRAANDLTRATLHIRAPGMGEQQREGVLVTHGIQRFVLALGPGIPARVVDSVGALDRGARAITDTDADTAIQHPATPLDPLVVPGLSPPATIRVGFADAACTQSCCTASCTNTCAMSLETYVRRGLNDEWIASWNTQSLRAGSIAYRSYGAWRVANPIRPAFDICSSACCQVNDGDTSTNTDNATARTPGMMLTRNGSTVVASEYSAENNSWDDPGDGLNCSNSDLSCGDGFAGSPATGWPCLSDPVGAGRGCFGHGRGMSQWGTQRWAIDASARKWPWITDHYYNDNGTGTALRTAVMSSPLRLADLTVQPAVLGPGASFQILAQASNLAGADHAHLLVGASLYRAGIGYLDDPVHDVPISLSPGTQSISRSFDIPASASAGDYDVLLSLYLDVDENNLINTGDLALALERVDAAVRIVVEPPFTGFSDGFEGAP